MRKIKTFSTFESGAVFAFNSGNFLIAGWTLIGRKLHESVKSNVFIVLLFNEKVNRKF
jgi:hypothetical protein